MFRKWKGAGGGRVEERDLGDTNPYSSSPTFLSTFLVNLDN